MFGYFKIDFTKVESNRFGKFSLTFDEEELRSLKQLNYVVVQYKGGSFLQVGEFKEDELAIYGNLNDLYYIIYVANNT